MAPGDEVVVEHRSAGTRWTFVARTASGPRFTLHPIVLHDPDGSGTDADVLAEISSAWSTTEASCGIALQVEPTIAVTVDDPTELVRGITAIDEEERPADLIVPRSIDEVFDAAGVPDDALRVVIWPSASPLAATPRFYEFEGELNYAPTMLAYDGIENGEIVGAEPTTALRYRFALGNDQDSEGPDGEAWPWSVIIVHEIGHMLGLGHPDQTVDTSDDLTDNLMAGTHDYPESYGEAGQFANVTQRQCLQLALDLNGYADP